MTPKTVAAQFFDDNADFIANLYSRWLDESKYEDIKDYQKVIQDKNPQIEIVQMHKKPWGFTFKAEGKTYRFTMTTRQASYKRIA